MKLCEDFIQMLSDDRLPLLNGTGVNGLEAGFIANPNPGHATKRGTWKRAKSAGEDSTGGTRRKAEQGVGFGEGEGRRIRIQFTR